MPSVNVRKLEPLELLLERGPTRDDVMGNGQNRKPGLRPLNIKKNPTFKPCADLSPFHSDRHSWTLIGRSFEKMEVICSLKPFITVCSLIKPACKIRDKYKFEFDLNAILSNPDCKDHRPANDVLHL